VEGSSRVVRSKIVIERRPFLPLEYKCLPQPCLQNIAARCSRGAMSPSCPFQSLRSVGNGSMRIGLAPHLFARDLSGEVRVVGDPAGADECRPSSPVVLRDRIAQLAVEMQLVRQQLLRKLVLEGHLHHHLLPAVVLPKVDAPEAARCVRRCPVHAEVAPSQHERWAPGRYRTWPTSSCEYWRSLDEGCGGRRGTEARPRGVARVVEGRRAGESCKSQRSEGGQPSLHISERLWSVAGSVVPMLF